MIVPFFPPSAGGGVYRSLGFVKYLGKYGWRPSVLAPDADAFWISDASLLEDVPDGCDVHRSKSISGQFLLSRLRSRESRRAQVRSSRTFGWLRRLGAYVLLPDTYVGWYPFAVRRGAALLRGGGFDAIYSTSPPETAHLVGLKLHALSRLPWIADFRDPWMNLHLFPPPTPVHRLIHRSMERRVCARATVVVTSRWHAERVAEAYPGCRPTVIPNGYDHEKLDRHAGCVPPPGEFRILHAGMLTQRRSVAPFLDGLQAFLGRNPGARDRCRVVFAGPRESGNDQAVAARGLGDVVEFIDSVSHDEALQLEHRSHILLLIKHMNPLYHGIIPGKLYEYLGARRPILAIAPDGEARDIVVHLNRGEVASHDDPSEIARVIERMYRSYSAGSLDRDYDLSIAADYTREKLAGDLAACLDSAAAARR